MRVVLLRITFILLLIALIVYGIKFNKPTKIVTKTEYIEKTDTIHEVEIKEIPVVRYVNRTKTIKDNDSIVYVSSEDTTAIQANEYEATVKTDSSRADLKILTTGELLDVKGTITYDKQLTTVTKHLNASGLFVSTQTDLNFSNFGLFLDYVYKNTIIAGVSANYSTLHKSSYIGFKLGIKIK